MGGIVALLGYELGISDTLVRKMCGVLEPRGSDDSGWFVGADVTLGNVASYKDSTKMAHQPLCNVDGSIWISFGGELYNSDQLKKQFGYNEFMTISDVELVLKAYEKNGHSCLKQLDGIFAFCVGTPQGGSCCVQETERALVYPARGQHLSVDSQGDVKVIREKGVLRNISAPVVP